MDDQEPKTPEEAAAEQAAAEALARALETDDGAEAELLRAATGRAAPLGALRARGLARAAVEEVERRRHADAQRRRRQERLTLALAAVALLLWLVLPRWWAGGAGAVPSRLRARSAGLLVPGPFPAAQTAAERLDRVTADRLIALREVGVRRVRSARGAR